MVGEERNNGYPESRFESDGYSKESIALKSLGNNHIKAIFSTRQANVPCSYTIVLVHKLPQSPSIPLSNDETAHFLPYSSNYTYFTARVLQKSNTAEQVEKFQVACKSAEWLKSSVSFQEQLHRVSMILE